MTFLEFCATNHCTDDERRMLWCFWVALRLHRMLGTLPGYMPRGLSHRALAAAPEPEEGG
jgi:hypothetical protein